MSLSGIKFGLPNEWKAFIERHPLLTNKLQLLFKTQNKAFIRQVEMKSPADRVIFLLGRLCVEDFMEILLLCGNGYGFGGMKLLRGLYERAVTLGYIVKNPQKAEEFINYHYIHRGKQFNHAKELLINRLSPEMIDEIQNTFNQTKEKYQEIVCKKCGTKRTRLSWSDLDTLSMARNVGLEVLYPQCYYEPTLQAHTTVSSLMSRIRIGEDGQIIFNEDAKHKEADLALIGAHNIILIVLGVENNYFGMGLQEEIDKLCNDFKLIWKDKEWESNL